MNKKIVNPIDDVPLIKRMLILGFVIIFFQFSFPQYSDANYIVEYPIEGVYLTSGTHSTIPFISDEAHKQALKYNLELKKQYKIKRTMIIPVTAYSSTVDQCDSTPFITASGTHVRDGIIATNYLPIGTKVRFPDIYGDKIFVVEDRMNARFYYKADIWMETRSQAGAWGLKHLKMEVIEG